MNLISGYPFWLIRSGLPFDYPLLDGDISTEVVVMGGGISGALAAYHLREAGIDCLVIDKRTIGLGSTCASTSLLQYEIDVPLSELQKKIGVKEAIEAYKLCEGAISSLEDIAARIGFKQFEKRESLYFAQNRRHRSFIKEEFQARKDSGFDVRLLEKEEIKEKYFIDSDAAILSTCAAQTNAYGFTHALHQYNLAKGMKVYDRTDAVKIEHSADGVKIETNRGHAIRAKKLVYANGYEATQYVDEKIVELTSTYAICSEQMTENEMGINTNALYWNTADPYLYVRNTPDGRILIGGRDETFYSPEKRDRLIEKKAKQLEADCLKLFPLTKFRREFAWTGTFGATKDGLPYIGEYPKLPNSYFALGFGGNGVTFSLIAAAFLTGMLRGINPPALNLFAFNRS